MNTLFVDNLNNSIEIKVSFSSYSFTAKRILERLGIQTSSSSKFDRSVFLNLKQIFYFFGIYIAVFFI